MCCFHYFLRLVEQSSASSFDDLRYMSDYNVSFVGKVNFKFNLKIIPTILKLVTCQKMSESQTGAGNLKNFKF